jgi:hypothetical protein
MATQPASWQCEQINYLTNLHNKEHWVYSKTARLGVNIQWTSICNHRHAPTSNCPGFEIPPNYKSTSLHDKVEAFNIERMKQSERNLFPSQMHSGGKVFKLLRKGSCKMKKFGIHSNSSSTSLQVVGGSKTGRNSRKMANHAKQMKRPPATPGERGILQQGTNCKHPAV